MVSWTNHSVIAFSEGGDPVAKIQNKARKIALAALEAGWDGPPFNPIRIAEMLGARVVPNSDIADARTIAASGRPVIEFNPRQPRERVRFSIAHEVAHLLFTDVLDKTRHRGGTESTNDEWQLEMLCNLAASEFVMPIGSLVSMETPNRLRDLMKYRAQFDVSAEAFMIRFAKTSSLSVGVLCASPFQSSAGSWSYRIDYFIPSAISPTPTISGRIIPPESAIHRCTAIGFTDYGQESWVNGRLLDIEYVGIPGYPGTSLPRAIGLIHFEGAVEGPQPIKYVHGNVLEPRGGGPKIVCQLVNDRAMRWGGGIARQTAKLYPSAEAAFSRWLSEHEMGVALGEIHICDVAEDLSIISLVGQSGFGASAAPRIRYAAVERALLRISDVASQRKASVHMPRIGTGAAGGEWSAVEDLIQDTLVRHGIAVTVYDLPPKRPQLELF